MFEKNTLVLFSGGKDSFLTACRCIERGDCVGLLAMNNGCIAGEECIQGSAQRMINKYGEERVHYEGIYSTYSTILRLNEWWSTATYDEVARKLPNVDGVQMNCLHCQTAMWTAAIAYATAKGFTTVCSGYRHDDSFCTGSVLYTDAIKKIASKYNVLVEFPVWDEEGKDMSWEAHRDQEIAACGFYPSLLEPQCALGRPTPHHIKNVSGTLSDYFAEYLEPIMTQRIPKLRETLRHMKLTEKSLSLSKYIIPSGVTGMY